MRRDAARRGLPAGPPRRGRTQASPALGRPPPASCRRRRAAGASCSAPSAATRGGRRAGPRTVRTAARAGAGAPSVQDSRSAPGSFSIAEARAAAHRAGRAARPAPQGGTASKRRRHDGRPACGQVPEKPRSDDRTTTMFTTIAPTRGRQNAVRGQFPPSGRRIERRTGRRGPNHQGTRDECEYQSSASARRRWPRLRA